MPDMPRAEVDITPELVAGLVARQFPAFREQPVRWLGHGWDNELFRLGEELLVRLPRRLDGVALVDHEQRWLPSLAVQSPLATSTPLHFGVADEGFPWPWSICAYLPGRSVLATLDAGASIDLADAARSLGTFLASFHRPAPVDAPRNDWRGVPIVDRLERFDQHRSVMADRLAPRHLADLDAVVAAAAAAAPWVGPPMWLHGDVHPGNLISRRGRLTGVADFGDLTSGDPASDLSVAWTLFDAETRPLFQAAFDHDAATWTRARGWTVVLGMAMAANSADNPSYTRMARRMLTEAVRPQPQG